MRSSFVIFFFGLAEWGKRREEKRSVRGELAHPCILLNCPLLCVVIISCYHLLSSLVKGRGRGKGWEGRGGNHLRVLNLSLAILFNCSFFYELWSSSVYHLLWCFPVKRGLEERRGRKHLCGTGLSSLSSFSVHVMYCDHLLLSSLVFSLVRERGRKRRGEEKFFGGSWSILSILFNCSFYVLGSSSVIIFFGGF